MMWLARLRALVEFAFALAAAGVIRRHIRESPVPPRHRAFRLNERCLRAFYDRARRDGAWSSCSTDDIMLRLRPRVDVRLFDVGAPGGSAHADWAASPQSSALFVQKYRRAYARTSRAIRFDGMTGSTNAGLRSRHCVR